MPPLFHARFAAVAADIFDIFYAIPFLRTPHTPAMPLLLMPFMAFFIFTRYAAIIFITPMLFFSPLLMPVFSSFRFDCRHHFHVILRY